MILRVSRNIPAIICIQTTVLQAYQCDNCNDSDSFTKLRGSNFDDSDDCESFARLAGGNYQGCDATLRITIRDLYACDLGIISIIPVIILTLLFVDVLDGGREMNEA
jgi:hypothetical protein